MKISGLCLFQHLFPDSHEDINHAEELQHLLAEEQKKIEDDGKKVTFMLLNTFIYSVNEGLR